jgi:hypothetical protein
VVEGDVKYSEEGSMAECWESETGIRAKERKRKIFNLWKREK